MKHALTSLFLLIGIHAGAQVLWLEDFEAEADGAQTGTASGTIGGNWTATYGGAGIFSKQSPAGNLFQVTNTDTEGVWNMNAPISIAGTGRAIIEVTVVGFFVAAGDYFRAYYRVDGGPEILFFEQTGGILSFTLTGSAIVTGGTLEVVIRSSTDGSFIGIDSFTFDDVRITGVNTLYSRKSGNWNDVAPGNGTWSLIAIGGVSCDCSPIATDYVIVGGGHTVDINVGATAGGVEVQNTGSLRYTVDAVDLNIDRGILQVDVGGTINQNARTGVQIDFDRGIVNSFTNNGAITTESMEVTAASATLNITGGGSIVLTQDFNIIADDIIVDNDLNGTFSIGDDLVFDQPGDVGSDDAQFINRRTLTVASDIVVGANNDDDNIFANQAGAILNVVAITLNNADFDILNSGTINQSGTFNTIDGVDSNLDNLATGVWNWTFAQAAFDLSLNTVLNCAAIGNVFNYGAGGNQNVISTPYYHLTLSGSGSKLSQATVDINGDLLIAGVAILDINSGVDNITLAGNWTVTSTDPDPFIEGAQRVTLDGSTNAQVISTVLAGGETFSFLVLNNTFLSSPQITLSANVIVNTTLTMTQGNVNLNGRDFTIVSNLPAALIHPFAASNGWMFGGNLIRGMINTAVAVGTVRGFFPMGTAGDFRPLFIGKPTGTTSGFITVNHNSALSTTSVVSFADDLTITLRHNSFWTATTTITGGLDTWSLRAGGTNFGTIASITHLRLSTSVGVVGTPGVNTGTTADPRVERLNLSIANINANNFHISSVDAVNSPLPIELTSFDAVAENGRVRLNWTTATEVNNDFFTIERTINAEEFELVEKIEGQGTTIQTSAYVSYDMEPLSGVSYYRLKQTDFNGEFTYSKLVKVEVDGKKMRVMAFPNPTVNQQVTLTVSGLKPFEEIGLSITDTRGVSAYRERHIATADGDVKSRIDLSKVSKGLYIIAVSSSTAMSTRLMVE